MLHERIDKNDIPRQPASKEHTHHLDHGFYLPCPTQRNQGKGLIPVLGLWKKQIRHDHLAVSESKTVLGECVRHP